MSRQQDIRAGDNPLIISIGSCPALHELEWLLCGKSSGGGYDGGGGNGNGDSQCEYNDCKEDALDECAYCGRDFCEEHLPREEHKC